MDAFSYLSVLLSIILGLAITQILQGYRALLLARDRVVPYAPALIWSGLMLVLAVQSWWASFGFVHVRAWTFASFGMVILQTIITYLMAGLSLPDVPAAGPVDLALHYHREARIFYGLALVLLAVSIIKEWMLNRTLPIPENLAFHGLFASLSLIGLLTRSRRIHAVLAVAAAIWVVAYIALLFARL